MTRATLTGPGQAKYAIDMRSSARRPEDAALTGLLPGRLTSEEHIARAREIRASLGGQKFAPAEIDRLKREGRP